MYKIRFGRRDDVDQVVPLLAEFTSEYAVFGEADEDIVTESFYKFIDNETLVFIVVELEGKILGFICGFVTPMLFKRASQAQELFWFVSSQERNVKIGLKLLEGFEQVCKDRGARYVSMVAPSSLKLDKLEKLYQRLGYRKTETTYTKELI